MRLAHAAGTRALLLAPRCRGGTSPQKSLLGDQHPASCIICEPSWLPSPCHLPLSALGCSGSPLVAFPCPLRASPLGAGLRFQSEPEAVCRGTWCSGGRAGLGGGLQLAVLQTGHDNLEIIFQKMLCILPSADLCPPGAAAGRGWVLSPLQPCGTLGVGSARWGFTPVLSKGC